MKPEPACFDDRVHAGRVLAEALLCYADRSDVTVLGLPRGGIPVAREVATKLQAPLDVVVVLILRVRGREDFTMGAIASGGVRTLDEDLMSRNRVTPEEIRAATLSGMRELQRREVMYRGQAGAPDVEGKTVILVDDGIVTGTTIRSAVRSLRPQDPAGIIIAAPAASREGCLLLRPLVDDLVALMIPDEFHALGRWYKSLEGVGDEEVTRLLSEACEHTRLPPGG